jgi:hypothetical protein
MTSHLSVVLSVVLSVLPLTTPLGRSVLRGDQGYSSSHHVVLSRLPLRGPDLDFCVLSPLTPKGGTPSLRGQVLPGVFGGLS